MEKIDFVVTWVDGSDGEWLAEKRKYLDVASSTASSLAGGEANADCRYRDCGLLKYWFRSVEKFAPWADRVFFVTCGQKPDWLDESNPKLRLVSHADYIPQEYLPTFHSDTIELNLHRIPDLSERFVLFNDDMFLLRSSTPDQFFRGGIPVLACDLGIPGWLGCSMASRIVVNNGGILAKSMDVVGLIWCNLFKFVNVRELGFARAAKNLASFAVNRMFIPGTFGHIPLPHLKSTFEEIWRVQPGIMDKTSRSRFRINDGVSHWLASAWNMAKGDFVPLNEKRRGETVLLDDKNLERVCKLVSSQAFPQVCINDSERISDPEGSFKRIAAAFESILPDKSSFEK